MQSRWELWLSDPTGVRIMPLDNVSAFNVIRKVNNIGQFEVTVSKTYDPTLFPLDYLIEFWRAPQDGALSLQSVGFIRDVDCTRYATKLRGPDQVDLLQRRIVAYAAGSAQAEKTDNADDILKAYVTENFISPTDTTRTMAGISVAGDVSLGASVTYSAGWSNVLTAMKAVCDSSSKAGTDVYFDLVPYIAGEAINYRFETYTGQPGVDRSSTGGVNQMFFGLEYGNMLNVHFETDRRQEGTYAYAGLKGAEDSRTITEVSSSRKGDSIWNRREIWVDASMQDTTDGASTAGSNALLDQAPEKTFDCELLSMQGCEYGADWSYGDRITAVFRGQHYDVLVSSISLSVSSADTGQEDKDPITGETRTEVYGIPPAEQQSSGGGGGGKKKKKKETIGSTLTGSKLTGGG